MLSGGTKSKAKRNPEKEGKDSNRTDTDNMQGVEDGNQETTDSTRGFKQYKQLREFCSELKVELDTFKDEFKMQIRGI